MAALFFILISISPLIWAMKFSKNLIAQIYILALIYVTIKIQLGESSIALLIVIFVLMSNILVLLAAAIFPTKSWRVKIKQSRKLLKSQFISVLYGLLAIHLLAIGAGGYGNLMGSWLIIKEQLDGGNFYRLSSMISYCLAVGYYIHWRLSSDYRKWYADVGVLLLLIIYAIAIKVKLFIIPPLIALFLVKNGKSINGIKMVRYAFLVVFAYFTVMTVRWAGDIEDLSYDIFLETLRSVGDAGVERELFHQSTSVFKYYQISDFNYGQSIRRIFMQLYSMIGATNELPENPMYKYYAISNNGLYVEGASAHPSVYADSFAEWGWLGVFIPSLYIMILSWMSNKYSGKISDAISFSFLFISMPLLVRGSTYYAYIYLFVAIFLISLKDFMKYGTLHKK